MKNLILMVLITMFLLKTNTARTEPLVRIINSPCEFHDKKIYTSGILGVVSPFEPSKARLFLNLEDFKYNNLEQSIIVNLPEDIVVKKEKFNKKYVSLSGVFNCNISSHANIGSGGFQKINNIRLAEKNPNFNPNEFTAGNVKSVTRKDVKDFVDKLIDRIIDKPKSIKNIKFIFGESNDDMLNSQRINWLLGDYFSGKNLEEYRLCNVFQYEDKNLGEGLFCLSRDQCIYKDKENAEELPDWYSEDDSFCLEFETKDGEIKLGVIQFL